MSDTGYNGWANYPTWAVNLWLSNDEGLYGQTLEVVRGSIGPDIEPDTVGVTDALKDFVLYELAPDLGASFAADLLGWALEQVNWHEIADAWLEEVTV